MKSKLTANHRLQATLMKPRAPEPEGWAAKSALSTIAVQLLFGGIRMSHNFTAVVKQDGPWWIGWIDEVPGVNCQERTRDELLKTLRVTLVQALEMNRTDARDAAGKGYEELSIAV